MAFLLCLIVFAITSNNGSARPVTDNKINIITRNGISNEEIENGGVKRESLGSTFDIPTVLKPGFIIKINGILNPTEKMFKAVLHGDRDCKIMYDFKNENIITSVEEQSEPEEYSLGEQVAKTFELSISIRAQPGIVAVTLQINNLGESNAMFCYVKDIKSIEMQEGVTRTDRFHYTNSYKY